MTGEAPDEQPEQMGSTIAARLVWFTEFPALLVFGNGGPESRSRATSSSMSEGHVDDGLALLEIRRQGRAWAGRGIRPTRVQWKSRLIAGTSPPMLISWKLCALTLITLPERSIFPWTSRNSAVRATRR